MVNRAGLAHPEIADSAARLYAAQLEGVEKVAESGEIREALRDLIETTRTAQRLGSRLQPSDVKFTCSSLDGLTTSECTGFVNQFQLGLGWDGAPVVVMGTETAGDPTKAEGLAWDSLQTTLILAGSPTDVIRALLDDASWWGKMQARELLTEPWRPFHVHTNDYYQTQWDAGTSTWENLAKIVAPDADNWPAILARRADPGLGDLTYQIERSGLPSKTAAGGKIPQAVRTDWLEQEVIPALRQTATVLITHGFGKPWKAWHTGDKRLFTAFLGQAVDLNWRKIAGNSLGHQMVGAHLVISMRALAEAFQPIRPEYLAEVRRLVRGAVPDLGP